MLIPLAGLAALAALAWMMFLPAVVARAVTARTGFDVRIERMAVNPFNARVQLSGLVLDNPAAYPSRNFIQVRAFEADARVFTLFGRRPVFDSLAIDVSLLAVVKDTDGTSNLDLFRSRLARAGAANASARAQPPPTPRSADASKFLIKRLDLRCERLQFTDFTASRPGMREFNLDFSHTYTDVSDPAQLLVPALFHRVGEAGVIFGGLLSGFGDARGDDQRSRPGGLGEAARRASEAFKSLFSKLEDSPKP